MSDSPPLCHAPSPTNSVPTPVLDLANLLIIDQSCSDGSLDAARDNIQILISELFSLPTTASNDGIGRLVELPDSKIKFPRSKPVPKPKPLTKWQMFAQQRGIQKKKKDKIAYDEQSGEWKRVYGYKRANDENDQWVIEHKDGSDPTVDPFTQMSIDKKERIRRNKEKHQSNIVAARGDRIPGTIDLSSAIQAAGSQSKGRREARTEERKRKGIQKSEHLDTTLRVAQHSTASMGVFDELHSDEPKVRPPKRQKVPGIQSEPYNLAKERSQNLSILDQVVGKAPKESDVVNTSKVVNRLQVETEADGTSSRDKRSNKTSHKKKKLSNKAAKRKQSSKKKKGRKH